MAVDVQTESPGGTRQIVKIDAHTLYTDLGIASGGGASAPGAHDYFDASLAACKALTAISFAKKHGIALDKVEAHVDRDDTKEKDGTYVLNVKLAFSGNLSEADKTKLYNALGHCPVHKLMTTATIEINTAPLGT